MMTRDDGGNTDQNDRACETGWFFNLGVRAQMDVAGVERERQRWGGKGWDGREGWRPGCEGSESQAESAICRAWLTPKGLRRL